jgi:hypothetical protein
LAICGLIAGVLYLPALGPPPLWEPDEGRYAEIAREMLGSADYMLDLVRRSKWPSPGPLLRSKSGIPLP